MKGEPEQRPVEGVERESRGSPASAAARHGFAEERDIGIVATQKLLVEWLLCTRRWHACAIVRGWGGGCDRVGAEVWRAAGLAIHALNGALFGLAFHEARRILPAEPRRLAIGMAVAEHVALYPLCYIVDRYHPARGEPGIPRLLTNPRAFAQATWRHTLFGAVLGQLA